MHNQILRWFLILPALFILTSCGSKKSEEANVATTQPEVNNVSEQPIEVVVKRGPSNADHAPIEVRPGDEPAAVVPGDLPPPIVPGPPVPVPVVVGDTCEEIFCGDGHKQEGEECDDENDDEDDDCDNFCRKIRCGNGRVEGLEECDEPDNINCSEDCKLSLCGNGEVDDGETCDPPNDSTCNATCLTSVCGNGIVELGEECDDDNNVEGDGCSNACQLSCTPPSRNANPHN